MCLNLVGQAYMYLKSAVHNTDSGRHSLQALQEADSACKVLVTRVKHLGFTKQNVMRASVKENARGAKQ